VLYREHPNLLSNPEGSEAERAEKQIARELFGIASAELKRMPLPAGLVSTYVGTYEYGSMSLTVCEQDGMLKMKTPRLGVTHLVHQSDGLFVVAEDLSYEVVFAIGVPLCRRILS
jgi:hypothetical protein